MQLRETIDLAGKPFPKPLPIDAEILIEFFAKNGIKFEELDNELHFNGIYSSTRLPQVKKLIESKNLDVEIDHSIWTVYEDRDFKENPLWILYFPDIEIDGFDFEKVCEFCHKKTIFLDFEKKAPFVKSKKSILTVNGQFDIVKKELKNQMESELSGIHFLPFDERGEYFHLLAKNSLGDLINPPGDFFKYGGICPECKLPIFKMFFSPLKYSRCNWSGEDIISGAFHEGVFFTEKAFKILKSVEKEVIRHGVIILK